MSSWRAHLATASLLAAAFAMGGCGDDGRSDGSAARPDRDEEEVLVRCLQAAGARSAVAEQHLRDLVAKTTAENTNNTGVGFGEATKVDIFEPVLGDGKPVGGEDFLMYVLRAPDSEEPTSPAQALTDGMGILVIRAPSDDEVRRAYACFGVHE